MLMPDLVLIDAQTTQGSGFGVRRASCDREAARQSSIPDRLHRFVRADVSRGLLCGADDVVSADHRLVELKRACAFSSKISVIVIDWCVSKSSATAISSKRASMRSPIFRTAAPSMHA